ncbi:MAG: CRISPR-associated helicase Cas3' [Anaerovoracaceae bacterium]|jgi:CRISPR-associated endonuclease/helicase Cas3
MWNEFIARKHSDGRQQSLFAHSKNVAEISLATSHYPNTSKLLAYLHDLGKASSAFQKYIESGGDRGSVIHAWQGAGFINELEPDDILPSKLLKEIAGLCITAHHNHLSDGSAPDGTTDYFDRLAAIGDDKYHYEEIKNKITAQNKADIQAMYENAIPEMAEALENIKTIYNNGPSANFALGLLTKYLFSCLVDADRLDAYLSEVGESFTYQRQKWDTIIEIFEKNLAAFPTVKKIDKIRKTISDKCKAASTKETGIYQLSVPTGGGKTLSSLRFALHHCNKHNKKRIIYVIPYLSIVEQTAKSINDILGTSLGNHLVLEHHSNIIEPEDENASAIRKMSTTRWDRPIVITTMVQFLETAMSSKSGKLRKFAAMADAVIIFDEVQSIPLKAVHCFNEIVTFLSKMLNTTIVFCSATQPTLESTQRANLALPNDYKLIGCDDEFKDLKRVTISAVGEMNRDEASDFIYEKARENGNCLVITNTKKSALEIFNRLARSTEEFQCIHLSTSMCPVHRSEKINELKNCLRDEQPVICVSTQLIEAGVDISFSCVVRAMAGLDSIAQAAGRCNRNGESAVPKIVYTFSLGDENLERLVDIKSGKEITEQIVQNKESRSDLLDEDIMGTFYRRYFSGKGIQMDCPVGGGATVYGMLSGNKLGRENYMNRKGNQFPHFMGHAFHSADASFRVIDDNTKSVVVMYGIAGELVNRYRNFPDGIVTKEKIQIIKDLQKHSVSLYEWQLQELDRRKALSLLDRDTGIILLDEAYYTDETGVIFDAMQQDLII